MAERKAKKTPSMLEQVRGILSSRVSPAQGRHAAYYAQAFLRRIPEDELSGENPATLAAIIASQMKFASRVDKDNPTVRVFNPTEESDGWSSQHTIVEMVNPDMPFLVDTTHLAMAELNLGVHLMVHPVIHVERDSRGRAKGFYPTAEGRGEPESIIHMQVDRVGQPEQLAAVESRLLKSMSEVRLAVADWQQIVRRVEEAREKLPEWAANCDTSMLEESQEFLQWIADEHFIFLGTRDYEIIRAKDQTTLEVIEGSGLGILRESEKTIRSRPLATLADGGLTERDHPLIITKTRNRSHVHRGGYMDYLGVLQFNSKGEVVGERRFIGLFTSNAYFRRIKDTPLLRNKVERVLASSGLREGSHARKSLVHILETLPVTTCSRRRWKRSPGSPKPYSICRNAKGSDCSCGASDSAGFSPAWCISLAITSVPRFGNRCRTYSSGRSRANSWTTRCRFPSPCWLVCRSSSGHGPAPNRILISGSWNRNHRRRAFLAR